MLHGLRSYARTFEPLATRLMDRYRVLALDARGRGDSDWDPSGEYYTPAYVADLEQFAEQLGLDRFVILGHSMGGATAYVHAARHPGQITAAVIEDIGPGSSLSGAGAERIKREVAVTPAAFSSLDAAARTGALRPSILPRPAIRPVSSTRSGRMRTAAGLEVRPGRHRPARLSSDPVARRRSLAQCVAALRCPTLVLRGGGRTSCRSGPASSCPHATAAALDLRSRCRSLRPRRHPVGSTRPEPVPDQLEAAGMSTHTEPAPKWRSSARGPWESTTANLPRPLRRDRRADRPQTGIVEYPRAIGIDDEGCGAAGRSASPT